MTAFKTSVRIERPIEEVFAYGTSFVISGGLHGTEDANRRVLAVLAHLRSAKAHG
jgi:hypothetical protein